MYRESRTVLLWATTLGFSTGGTAVADGGAGGIPLEKTPAKVQASVKKELPLAKPTEVKIQEHLRPNGKKYYEIDFESGAMDIEIEVAEGGAVKKRRDRVPLSAVPKPVVDMGKRERKEKSGVQTSYGVKVVEKDETFFELHFDNPEGKLKLRYEPDGSLIRRAQELKVAALPKPVADTAARELGGAKVDRAARVTKSDGISYRIEGGSGAKEVELKIAPDGKLLEREGPGAGVKPAGKPATAAGTPGKPAVGGRAND